MQNRTMLLALLMVALSTTGFAQPNGSDASTIAAILAELRSIHEDLRASQSMQILLAELQLEQGAVNRASDRVDEARSRLIQVQAGLKGMSAHLSDAQDHLDNVLDPAEQKRWKDDVDRTQVTVAAMKAEEQARSSALDDLQAKLHNAEDDLNKTQEELNALIQRLAPAQSSAPAH